MAKPLDREGIAAAMRETAWKAVHGTREERSGVFNPAPAKTLAARTAVQRSVKRGG